MSTWKHTVPFIFLSSGMFHVAVRDIVRDGDPLATDPIALVQSPVTMASAASRFSIALNA